MHGYCDANIFFNYKHVHNRNYIQKDYEQSTNNTTIDHNHVTNLMQTIHNLRKTHDNIPLHTPWNANNVRRMSVATLVHYVVIMVPTSIYP